MRRPGARDPAGLQVWRILFIFGLLCGARHLLTTRGALGPHRAGQEE